jgi:hypothetical protein
VCGLDDFSVVGSIIYSILIYLKAVHFGYARCGSTFTDCALASIAKKFGFDDLGPEAIQKFFEGHQCNQICAYLKIEKYKFERIMKERILWILPLIPFYKMNDLQRIINPGKKKAAPGQIFFVNPKVIQLHSWLTWVVNRNLPLSVVETKEYRDYSCLDSIGVDTLTKYLGLVDMEIERWLDGRNHPLLWSFCSISEGDSQLSAISYNISSV